jgi:hypothetical protein
VPSSRVVPHSFSWEPSMYHPSLSLVGRCTGTYARLRAPVSLCPIFGRSGTQRPCSSQCYRRPGKSRRRHAAPQCVPCIVPLPLYSPRHAALIVGNSGHPLVDWLTSTHDRRFLRRLGHRRCSHCPGSNLHNRRAPGGRDQLTATCERCVDCLRRIHKGDLLERRI